MLVSYRLLKELIDFPYSPNELATKFTYLGLEVEKVEESKKLFEKVITAKVVDVKEIPQTKLFDVLVLVSNSETKHVVTAATNVKIGDVVPLALVSGKVADGRLIQEKEFNGIVSQGMLCSYSELGLNPEFLSNDEKNGILILPSDTPLFKDFESVFPVEDYYLEFSLLPDRADAFNVVGIARWVEIILAREEKRKANFDKFIPKVSLESNLPQTPFEVEIVDEEHAKFYSGRLITDVAVKKSSYKLRNALYKLGVRPINNIVDITNYVAKMYGQPLHAFDFDKLNKKIYVRLAKDGEKIKTLDGVERQLSNKNLVIADENGPVAIAGVMGGEETAVTEQTKNVFLEAAYFTPSTISKSARTIGLITDASSLFEKGVDPEFTPLASVIASLMIVEEGGGNIYKDSIHDLRKPKERVKLRISKASSLLGEDLSQEEVKKYFDMEGFEYEEDNGTFYVKAPSFRQDINIEEDLVEEIVRMRGYNEFKETPIVGPIRSGSIEEIQKFNTLLRNFFVGCGLNEVVTSTLLSKDLLTKYSIFDEQRVIKLLNPLTEDMSYLRPSLFPQMIEAANKNININIKDLALFEVGKIFFKVDNDFKEEYSFGIFLTGERIEKNPYGKSLKYDFFYLKGILEDLFNYLKVDANFVNAKIPYLHPYQTAKIFVKDEELGYLGKIHPDIIENAYFAEVKVQKLLELASLEAHFTQFSKFPSVKRDIAVVVDESVEEVKVREAILSSGIKELKKIVLFDVYRGQPLPQGKKNLAYSLEFVSDERTLTSERVDTFILEIEKSINEKVNGTLRKQ